jgi:hypothetical protein
MTEGVYLSRGMSVEETRARLRAGEAEDGKPDADACELAGAIGEQANELQHLFFVASRGLRLLVDHLSDLSSCPDGGQADALARLLETHATTAAEIHCHKLIMATMSLERLLKGGQPCP